MGDLVDQWKSHSLMKKNALIIFAKNIVLGKVKTRLAKTIGDSGAFNVYVKLYEITEHESTKVEGADIRVYFSDVIINSKWPKSERFIQKGKDLGERMKNAFNDAFEAGYENVVCIGSDLPDIKSRIIEDAFLKLNKNDLVFGPAADGGYYLVGMNKTHLYIFENKPWSTDQLLSITRKEIETEGHLYSLLDVLNDIDTIQDLKQSTLSDQFKHYYELFERNQQSLQSSSTNT